MTLFWNIRCCCMKLSGIDGVIVDWYGTAEFNDYAVLNAATGKFFEVMRPAPA